jgi:hypothetical protein
VFVAAAMRFNERRGLKSGDPKYVDPQFLKAWAMVESGGSKSAFLSDPLQVNVPGDWNTQKLEMLGFQKGRMMTPELSVEGALKWLEYKGSLRGRWSGYQTALRNYNGNNRRYSYTGDLPHSEWYARHIKELYASSK